MLEQVLEDVATIEEFISQSLTIIPDNAELVLDIDLDADDTQTGYYFVDHAARGIFLLDQYMPENITIHTLGQLRRLCTFLTFISVF